MEEETELHEVGADKDLTDGSTDSEAEAKAATANEPHTKIKKKTSRKEREAKAGKGSQGKGGATDIIKVADQVKAKRKN